MNQIENLTQFVAALISSHKVQGQHESSLDKALAAQLLSLKDQDLYGKIAQNILDQVDKKSLDPTDRALMHQAPKT